MYSCELIPLQTLESAKPKPKRVKEKAPKFSERGEFKLNGGGTGIVVGQLAFRVIPLKMGKL